MFIKQIFSGIFQYDECLISWTFKATLPSILAPIINSFDFIIEEKNISEATFIYSQMNNWRKTILWNKCVCNNGASYTWIKNNKKCIKTALYLQLLLFCSYKLWSETLYFDLISPLTDKKNY